MSTALPLEVAVGAVLGRAPSPRPLPDNGLDARVAIEDAILPALLRPPCLVSFSGGRDSSAVLAAAVKLARREGLDLPIPATNVFPEADDADESVWQAAVVDHLGLPDWLRLEHRDELDVIGPYACRVMERHGLLMPFNIHFHLPLLDAAAGGSLLTGVGGDELFLASHATGSLLHARPSRIPRHLALAALSALPLGLRVALRAWRRPLDLPWLTTQARRLATARISRFDAGIPRALRERMAWFHGLRYLQEGTAALQAVADDGDVLVVNPLLAGELWTAVGRLAGPRGFVNRTHGMRALFGDALPDQNLGRRSKASFDAAFWTETARSFARTWDGTGVPTQYVDAEALAGHWNSGRACASSFTLLQAARLAAGRERAKEDLDGVLV